MLLCFPLILLLVNKASIYSPGTAFEFKQNKIRKRRFWKFLIQIRCTYTYTEGLTEFFNVFYNMWLVLVVLKTRFFQFHTHIRAHPHTHVYVSPYSYLLTCIYPLDLLFFRLIMDSFRYCKLPYIFVIVYKSLSLQ